jgi:hypothetical protein
MVSTTRITSNVKISEFPEMADALLDAYNNNSQNRWAILELLAKQTEAKQNKFWKFYDAFVAEKNCVVMEQDSRIGLINRFSPKAGA